LQFQKLINCTKRDCSGLTFPSALTRLQRLKFLLGMTLPHPKTIQYQLLIALNIQRYLFHHLFKQMSGMKSLQNCRSAFMWVRQREEAGKFHLPQRKYLNLVLILFLLLPVLKVFLLSFNPCFIFPFSPIHLKFNYSLVSFSVSFSLFFSCTPPLYTSFINRFTRDAANRYSYVMFRKKMLFYFILLMPTVDYGELLEYLSFTWQQQNIFLQFQLQGTRVSSL
jgi:hypothetical protein